MILPPSSVAGAGRGAVLVTDGDQRASLALVRSLRRAGYMPYVCATSRASLAGASRYACGRAEVPDPLHEPDGFVDEVARLVERWDVQMLLPVSEASLLAILPARARFAGVCLPFPDKDAFRQVSDKALLLRAARESGVAVPSQVTLDAVSDRERLDMEALDYPLVIKPARSVAVGNGTRLKTGVSHAADAVQLRAELDAFPAGAYPLLLQQRVVGPGVGIFLLLWEGEHLATFAHRRIREKPPSGGISVFRESIPAEPSLVAASRSLLTRFDWTGVAMVEYKVDRATGIPYLMEINGRFWGSLQLAIDAGVDFPVLLADAARGAVPRPVHDYRSGVKCRWWWGEVDHLLARLRRSPRELALPPDAPPRWRVLYDLIRFWDADVRNEILRLDDPGPFVRETILWFQGR